MEIEGYLYVYNKVLGMPNYREGDWVKTRFDGYVGTFKVLEVRPDGVLVLGNHDNDPNTMAREPDDIIGKL